MDKIVVAAMARWPNVPDVYGWLALDRRGQWRLQESPVANPHINEFIGRNYQCDARGAWYFQNGPQRVFVALDSAPWILRIGDAGTLRTHTGDAVAGLREALLDESGNLFLLFERGLGQVDDRDLSSLLDNIVDAHGVKADDAALMALMDGQDTALHLQWQAQRVPLIPISSNLVPARFGFVANPQPAAG